MKGNLIGTKAIAQQTPEQRSQAIAQAKLGRCSGKVWERQRKEWTTYLVKREEIAQIMGKKIENTFLEVSKGFWRILKVARNETRKKNYGVFVFQKQGTF